MKILLLGKNGQVGWELQRALAPIGSLIAPDKEIANFERPDQVVDLVREVRADVVVNAAAYTAVDKAQDEPEVARLINTVTPAAVAEEVAKAGAWMVHFSTDYVFDGSGQEPRSESAPTAPLGVYGQTKLDAEHLIAASGCQYLILRTSWVYAARGNNFAKTMLRLATLKDELKVIDDQFGAPTGAELLADSTAHVLRSLALPSAQASKFRGLYHLAAAGETTWFKYACYVIEWARSHGQSVRVASQSICPIATRQYPTLAQRPLNSRLDTSKLQNTFGLVMPKWEIGVNRMLAEHFGL